MTYVQVENKIIANVVVCDEKIAELMGFLPGYDDARIGDVYNPPKQTTEQDTILDLLADHEYRLCMAELNGGETTI